MPDAVESRIYALLNEYIGVDQAKLSAESRLSFDLGMEGIDAEEFFDRYKIEFSVDITDLQTYWTSYFSGEGTSPLLVFGWGLVAVTLKIASARFLPTWPGWICWILAFAIPLAGLLVWASLTKRPRSNEITIGELIKAAETGRLRLNPALPKTIEHRPVGNSSRN